MYRIIEFIRSIYLTILFVTLEGVAIYHYANSDSYTHAKLLGYTSYVVGGVGSATTSVADYFTLRKTNAMLMERLAELEQQQALYEVVKSDSTLNALSHIDTTGVRYMAARVVSNSINKPQNYMMLNRGLQHDIRAGMAVITLRREVVGVVVECAERYSMVRSILNTEFRWSGELLNDNHAGAISWDGVHRYRLRFDEISKYATINRGDTVVTTGFSQHFPAGITIGTIADYGLANHKRTYSAEVEIAAKMSALDEVLVVNTRGMNESQHTREEFVDEELERLQKEHGY